MASAQTLPMRVVVDSREQAPWSFNGAPVYEGTVVVQGSLSVGDYSIAGLEHLVAVERKGWQDWISCLGRERDRFVRELERARGLECFAVVVEGRFEDMARPRLQGHAQRAQRMPIAGQLRVPSQGARALRGKQGRRAVCRLVHPAPVPAGQAP